VNSATFFTADCRTHAKVVVVALLASIAACVVSVRVQAIPADSKSPRGDATGFVTAGS